MGHSIRALLKEQPVGQQKLVVFNASVTLNYLLLDLFEINNLATTRGKGAKLCPRCVFAGCVPGQMLTINLP